MKFASNVFAFALGRKTGRAKAETEIKKSEMAGSRGGGVEVSVRKVDTEEIW